MSVASADLETLHRLLRQRTDLQTRIERGPRQIRAAEGMLKAANEALETAKATVQRMRMTADEKQLQLKSHEARISDLEGKRNMCSTNKEYQTLVEQIAAAEMANSVLADEILENLEKCDELQQAVEDAKAEVEKAAADLARVTEKANSEHDRLAEDAARVEGELEAIEKTLPSEFRVEYNRVVKAKGEDALARLEGGSCGCCYQSFTPQILAEFELGQNCFCRGCGSIVYKPEGASVSNAG